MAQFEQHPSSAARKQSSSAAQQPSIQAALQLSKALCDQRVPEDLLRAAAAKNVSFRLVLRQHAAHMLVVRVHMLGMIPFPTRIPRNIRVAAFPCMQLHVFDAATGALDLEMVADVLPELELSDHPLYAAVSALHTACGLRAAGPQSMQRHVAFTSVGVGCLLAAAQPALYGLRTTGSKVKLPPSELQLDMRGAVQAEMQKQVATIDVAVIVRSAGALSKGADRLALSLSALAHAMDLLSGHTLTISKVGRLFVRERSLDASKQKAVEQSLKERARACGIDLHVHLYRL